MRSAIWIARTILLWPFYHTHRGLAGIKPDDRPARSSFDSLPDHSLPIAGVACFPELAVSNGCGWKNLAQDANRRPSASNPRQSWRELRRPNSCQNRYDRNERRFGLADSGLQSMLLNDGKLCESNIPTESPRRGHSGVRRRPADHHRHSPGSLGSRPQHRCRRRSFATPYRSVEGRLRPASTRPHRCKRRSPTTWPLPACRPRMSRSPSAT